MTNTELDKAPVPKSKKKLITLVTAGSLVLGAGVAATAIGISNYNAETQALCATALKSAAAAENDAKSSREAALAALETVKSTKLPKDGGTSTDFAKRPAVEAVKAEPAKDGKAEVKAVAARQSGADLIKAVAEDPLVKAKIEVAGDKCTDRDQVAKLTKSAEALEADAAELDTKVEALLADFATFQKDEAARIAAEKKAAEEKAAADAAAAAAAQAAADQAAADAYVEPDYSGGGEDYTDYSGGYDDGGYSGGGGGGGTIIDPGFGGGGCPPGMTCFG